MAALAATNSATPSLQSTLLQSRVVQARREADQAQAYADRLRDQANQQDRTVQQVRQRVQALEKQSISSANQVPSTGLEQRPQTQVEFKPTYGNVLAGVFQLAKPILTSDLSSTQKNVVKENLFEVTNATWSASSPSQSRITQSYNGPVTDTPSQTMGRILNTTV